MIHKKPGLIFFNFKWEEDSITTHSREYEIYINTPGKELSKQAGTRKINHRDNNKSKVSWGARTPKLPQYVIEMSSLKRIMKCATHQEIMDPTQEKSKQQKMPVGGWDFKLDKTLNKPH